MYTSAALAVGFRLSGAMLKDGRMDRGAFSLVLDGADVTAGIDIRATMDYPQSQGTLLCQLEPPLSPGSHRAAVFFPDQEGNKREYTWIFYVHRPLPQVG